MSEIGSSEQIFARLIEETRLAIEAGDLPVGSVLTVNGQVLLSARNSVRSQRGQRFHAERNLLTPLAACEIPAGRRVLYVTLEPCLRCAQAIARFGVDEVVYVLEDPFRGGTAILERAGIAVRRETAWEAACLEQAITFFSCYPEFCAIRQYSHALDAWWHLHPPSREERLRAVFLRHLSAYLPSVPPDRQATVRRAFLTHAAQLAALARDAGPGVPSAEFVVTLHQALFPPGFRHRAVDQEGNTVEAGSGEWRWFALAPRYTAFSAPERIEADLADLLASLPRGEAFCREDAMRFLIGVLSIRPFADGNGRLAAILADVLCVNHGLALLFVDMNHALFRTALLEDVQGGAPPHHQLSLADAWNRGQLGIRPRSMYDEQPEAFFTYAERSGNKRHVLAVVRAWLAAQPLNRHCVVTDIGAGHSAIADGLLAALAQERTGTFEYHYLEPHAANIERFRATSPHAVLPQVHIHALPVEDFLLPPSDLILASQSLQYVHTLRETLADMVAALKPGGRALIVATNPEGDEWRLINDLIPCNAIYPRIKECLDSQGIRYEEAQVRSSVRIAVSDRDTPAGDALLRFYFRQPAHALAPALKDAFWENVRKYAPTGAVTKVETFFWLRGVAASTASYLRP